VQFILGSYVATNYCISHLTKIHKTVTCEMQNMLQKCKYEQIKAFQQIKENRKWIINVEQLWTQLAIYIILSFSLYHSTQSFNIINTSQQQNRSFMLKH
jgi:hypothetical protein